ncbi:unnamed protein product [Diabrotica balteata]|uniref:Uncharacterized protein n=1 Tax=Diabrotica balteata TaxID=107213 RepID=A0A9N9TDW2_DIABA|nr:unnamed protein product [Diabrotica balteata]
MKLLFVIVVLVAVSFAVGLPTTEKCPPKQASYCTNPCHPIPTCQNRKPRSSVPISCGGLCIRRCECDIDNGYIRNTVDNRCVKEADCP